MMRMVAAVLLSVLATLATCGQRPGEAHAWRPVVEVQPYPPPRFDADGAVKGAALYRLTSPQPDFGGFSAMAWRGDGKGLTLFSDYGRVLDLPVLPKGGGRFTARLRRTGADTIRKSGRDIEAATAFGQTTWLALEHTNAVMRIDRDREQARTVRPRAMAQWPANSGPEALARLADGRFLVLREGKPWPGETDPIAGVLFAGDPVAGAAAREVAVVGAQGYHPVDAAVTPDGRLLVLLRRLRYRWPLVFDTRLALLDPAEFAEGAARLRTVAQLAPPLPQDNYEGLAVRADGARWDVWLVSDDNNSHFQSNWLARLAIDPAELAARIE